MKKTTKTNSNKLVTFLSDWEKKLNVYFGEKAPKLPEKFIKFLVKVIPYLVIVGVVAGAMSFLSSFGLSFKFWSLYRGYGYRYGFGFSWWNLFRIVIVIMEVMAIPGLFKKSKSAWNLMFYVSLVQALSYLVGLNLGSLIVGTAISWYFLFQIRKSYK